MKIKVRNVIMAVAAVLLLLGIAATAAYIGNQKETYVASSRQMSLCDLCEAAGELYEAVEAHDIAAVNRNAGRTEAYLSRCGLDGCEGIYSLLDGICERASIGEYDIELAYSLSNAARCALAGDGGESLRGLAGPDKKNNSLNGADFEGTTDYLMLERIGRCEDKIALKRATSFACHNAVLYKCDSSASFPPSFKFSGENVFISLTSDGGHVLLYCFDRDAVVGCRVSSEAAENEAERLIQRERIKLPLGTEKLTEVDGSVYRFDYTCEVDDVKTVIVRIEIYSDTGRLRKYDANNYYKFIK